MSYDTEEPPQPTRRFRNNRPARPKEERAGNRRNKPCPCNSGKKFKKCCFNPVDIPPLPPPTREQWEEAERALKRAERSVEDSARSHRNFKRGVAAHVMLAAALGLGFDARR